MTHGNRKPHHGAVVKYCSFELFYIVKEDLLLVRTSIWRIFHLLILWINSVIALRVTITCQEQETILLKQDSS